MIPDESSMQSEAEESAWVRSLFDRPLVDLGADGDVALESIFSPGYSEELVGRFMTEYYESIDGARSQAKKLDLTEYYRGLLGEALEATTLESECPVVLEIGCGFGSATFPLLELLPESQVVATELSTSMLVVLKEKLEAEGAEKRCALVQLNAEELDFKPESFDLVVGAAILHHLFQPEKVIEQAARLLKPGGAAIFFEPFENGFSIMSVMYQAILRDWRSWFLPKKVKEYLHYTLYFWQKMKGTDKEDPFFAGIDDKWLFTRQFFSDLAREHGFQGVEVVPLNKSDEPFLQFAEHHFSGNGIDNLPKWVWDLVKDHERLFSPDLKKDLLTEGCIIFRR